MAGERLAKLAIMARLSFSVPGRLREIFRLILNMSDEEIQLSSIKCLTKKLQMPDKRQNVFAYPDPVPNSDARFRYRNRFRNDSIFCWNRNQEYQNRVESELESESVISALESESRICYLSISLLSKVSCNWNPNQGFWVGIGIGVESTENWLESESESHMGWNRASLVPKSAKLKLRGNTIYYHHLTASNTYMQYHYQRIDFVELTQAHKNNQEQGA